MWTLKKARALFIRDFAIRTEYRVEILIWVLSGWLPLVMMFIWISLAEKGPVGDYNANDFAAYFLVVFFARQMTVIWVIGVLDRQIRLGDLSQKLLRPLDPYYEHAIDNLVDKLLRIPIILSFVIIGFWVADVSLEITLVKILGFILAIIGSWLIRFNQQYSFGLLTFWTDKATSFDSLWFLFYMVLSGAMAPISLFPESLRQIIVYTPFPYTIDFPVQLILGKLSQTEVLEGFLIQLGWVIVFGTLRVFMWRQGLKRYGAVGA